jgi:hypothetical protein
MENMAEADFHRDAASGTRVGETYLCHKEVCRTFTLPSRVAEFPVHAAIAVVFVQYGAIS